MSTAERTKGDLTKNAILTIALPIVSKVGFKGITIGNLADEMAMSKSGLFAHFRSKEQLQLAILDFAARDFVDKVLTPALKHPRGQPRVQALFDSWLLWDRSRHLPGGCVFVTAGIELDDDEPGPVRDRLVQLQRDWHEAVATAAKIAVKEGHFRPDFDAEQFAHDFYGVMLAYHHSSRLLRDPKAEDRVQMAFRMLLAQCRPFVPRKED